MSRLIYCWCLFRCYLKRICLIHNCVKKKLAICNISAIVLPKFKWKTHYWYDYWFWKSCSCDTTALRNVSLSMWQAYGRKETFIRKRDRTETTAFFFSSWNILLSGSHPSVFLGGPWDTHVPWEGALCSTKAAKTRESAIKLWMKPRLVSWLKSRKN